MRRKVMPRPRLHACEGPLQPNLRPPAKPLVGQKTKKTAIKLRDLPTNLEIAQRLIAVTQNQSLCLPRHRAIRFNPVCKEILARLCGSLSFPSALQDKHGNCSGSLVKPKWNEILVDRFLARTFSFLGIAIKKTLFADPGPIPQLLWLFRTSSQKG